MSAFRANRIEARSHSVELDLLSGNHTIKVARSRGEGKAKRQVFALYYKALHNNGPTEAILPHSRGIHHALRC